MIMKMVKIPREEHTKILKMTFVMRIIVSSPTYVHQIIQSLSTKCDINL